MALASFPTADFVSRFHSQFHRIVGGKIGLRASSVTIRETDVFYFETEYSI